ncbi:MULTISPECIES: metallophosphoesterase [Flavobacteriaceae]|uniref:metallophosphoesterase n=1 Tax=Flavobacteriaceae TaxID=49546 RepID=UPI0010AEE8C3|nr:MULTISPECIES: metallophosphoesterase [Flavobacteriaceae]NJB37189.1 twin-arginine translocation signal domain-containing protein [Croceivirga sp. JEA036]TKD59324.1 twin-arginine translocation signal domain-containing protein [Flavobacterium sp. ASW18X]
MVSRRRFLKGAAALAGTGAIMGLYSWQVEPHWLEFVHKRMPVANLPKPLVGKTLLQLSDIHVGPKVNQKYLLDAVAKGTSLNPDFVVYTGDFIHFENNDTFLDLKKVLQKAPKGALGTYAILGNHDYGEQWLDAEIADTITDLLTQEGITVLRNEQQNIHGLNIIGIDDYWGTNFFPKNVLKQYDASQANIALCHNPDVCDLDVWNGYQGWILSGHTHGGQCKLPLLEPPILPVQNPRYSAGEIDLFDGRTLYINRALGHLHQLRFNVRPEITVFTLEELNSFG